jgi:hypothetical protein
LVSAGESARAEAKAATRRALELHAAASEAERRARSFAVGGAAEERVARLLAELSAFDCHVLHDRRWPGTRAANIDHLVVGTGGVFVIDTKFWSDEIRVTSDGVFRGQVNCEDDLDKARRMADAVADQLAEVGLPATQILPILAFHGRHIRPVNVKGIWILASEQLARFILLRGKLLTQTQVEQLLTRLLVACPPATSSLASPQVPSQRDAATEEHEDELFPVAELEEAALEGAMRAPLADWMTFLHPSQARLVRRGGNGPSRISGPAGTGKSVVALHRLAHLAERGKGKFLYVTFVRAVPRIFSTAYARLSPHTADRVEFASLHSWAFRLVRDRRLVATVDQQGIEAAFSGAWRRVAPGTFLEQLGTRSYWREEIDWVIRGRSLTSREAYLELDRIGRGTRLGYQQRRVVWTLAEAYQDELDRRRLHDWNDVLRMARDEVRSQQLDICYDAVVLDEAQDMPLVAAELLHAVVGDRPGGLLLVGDDQQRVFPGGFRLSEAGIDVTGRSTKLTRNYRNTRQIVHVARSLVVGEDDDLLEGRVEHIETESMRDGDDPVFIRADDKQSHDAALRSHLTRLLQSPDCHPSDIAILSDRRIQLGRYRDVLAGFGIATVDLATWKGSDDDGIVIGTTKSAKGLEFKHVLVPNVDAILLRAEVPEDEYEAEQWRMRRRELYVAMTRARDTLWVGCVKPPVPAPSPVDAMGAAPVRDIRSLKSRTLTRNLAASDTSNES